MRFHVGIVPPNPDFHPENGDWQRLREPTGDTFLRLAMVSGAVIAGLLYLWSSAVASEGSADIAIRPGDLTVTRIVQTIATIGAAFAALIVTHEGIHLLVHPGSGLTRNSILGVWPKKLAFYAFYDAEMSRNRFVLMCSMPFLVLSVLPLALCTAFGTLPFWIGLVAIANGLFAVLIYAPPLWSYGSFPRSH